MGVWGIKKQAKEEITEPRKDFLGHSVAGRRGIQRRSRAQKERAEADNLRNIESKGVFQREREHGSIGRR